MDLEFMTSLPPPPCINPPSTVPSWAVVLLILIFVIAVISVGLNIMFVYKKRRLQREIAIRAHEAMQTSTFKRKLNDNGYHNGNAQENGPIFRNKTIALKKSRIEIGRENIGITVSLRSIGDGQFGNVWKGETKGLTVNDGHVIPVAARELPVALSNEDILENLLPLWRLKTHENIVQILGCCLETDPSYILTEYVTNGTLLTYLRTNGGIARNSVYANVDSIEPKHQITLMEQYLFAFDVANGMEYLSSKKVIHGSLCAHNILLTKEKRGKIADFGFSNLSKLAKVTKSRIYDKWMSPERLVNGQCSTEDDVWSYGVLVWEIMTYGRRPFAELGKENLRESLVDGYRLAIPEECDPVTSDLMKSCWREKDSERPTFEDIKKKLGDKVEEEADYFGLDSTDTYYACVVDYDS